MAKCDVCGEDENMPYNCRHCGGTYCGDHRLPENHNCTGLENWNDPKGVFDSGFDDSVQAGSSASKSTSQKVLDAVPIDTGPGGPLAYFRGNATYTILLLIWITWAAQMLVASLGGSNLYRSVFVLTPQNPEFVWTWVTSTFSHALPPRIFHIVFNSIVIFFFGPLVERYVGSKKFAILFVISGALAGLGQVAIQISQGLAETPFGGVVGASGAALAIMGVITVLNRTSGSTS